MMHIKNTNSSYGVVAKFFHWIMALAIIGMLAVGLYMEGLEISPDKFKLYGIHKSVGALLLSLVFLRLLWKSINVNPKLPRGMAWYEVAGAHSSHLMLYLLMLAMPLSGWMMSSFAGFPVSVFGWFTLPDLVAADRDMQKLFKEIHEYAGYFLIAVIAAHLGASLFHHFIKKDTILTRMLPW